MIFFLDTDANVFRTETSLVLISSSDLICILKVEVLSLLVSRITSAKTTQKNFLIFIIGSLLIARNIFDKSICTFLVNHLSILGKVTSIK